MRKASGTAGATGLARGVYAGPEVTRFGTVRDMTRNGGLANSDVPLGPSNSAYCDIISCGGGVLS